MRVGGHLLSALAAHCAQVSALELQQDAHHMAAHLHHRLPCMYAHNSA